ncbi:MAG TPA: nucleotidyltransferase domain-containing protein [Candidatus Nanoarchaeia archaeon]|nr:nucleotidyltransferase domain-containing protein [Candidatus Nanoarchaeia archaeon]
MNYKQDLIKALKKLNLFTKTNFIILFGSVSKGRANPLSDIDLCISLDLPPKERLQARIKLSGLLPEKCDIQVFEDLPLYVQKSVLSGKVLYRKNTKQLIERAIEVINEYDDFKKIYDYYLAKDKMAVEI